MRASLIVSAVWFHALSAVVSAGPPEYEFVPLDSGDFVATWAMAVSARGVVVGTGVDQAGYGRGVIWSGAGMQVLPTPSGYDNVGLGAMNSHGVAVGSVENVDWGRAGAIWDGEAWSLFEPKPGYSSVWLSNISDNGVAVGSMVGADTSAAIQIVDDQIVELEVLPGWSWVGARRVLEDGSIMGWRIEQGALLPVKWVGGVPEDVALPSDSSEIQTTAFGPLGQIGLIDFARPDGVWVGDGIDWRWIDGLGDDYVTIRSINASGDMVFGVHGIESLLLWRDGELHDLQDGTTLPDGFESAYTAAINDAGQIVGAYHAYDRPYAMLLNPVPPPGALATFGAAGLLACRRRRALLAAAAMIAPCSAVAAPIPRYFLDIVGPVVSGQTWPFAIDDSGRVVGMQERGPVVWQDGGVIALPTPFETFEAYASAVSAAGIAGVAIGLDGTEHVVLWRDGGMIDFSPFGGRYLFTTAISPMGQIVGWSRTDDPTDGDHSFLWIDGETTDLGSLGRDLWTHAYDVNASGQATGSSSTRGYVTHAFLWVEGGMSDLGALPGQAHSRGLAINDSGIVAGVSSPYDGGRSLPCVWERGEVEALPTLNHGGWVEAMNNEGTIVGEVWPEEGDGLGVVWVDREVHVLESMIIGNEAWRISYATDINECAQILAIGVLDAQRYGVVLTPACPADFNMDRVVDSRDAVAFFNAWASGSNDADSNGDGEVNTLDVLDYLSHWSGGC